jgi:hypothetical protein
MLQLRTLGNKKPFGQNLVSQNKYRDNHIHLKELRSKTPDDGSMVIKAAAFSFPLPA